MYFKFPCPDCGKNLKVRDELIGRKCACPYCRNTLTVPQPAAPEEPADELAGLDQLANLDTSTTAKKPGKSAPAANSGAVTQGTDVSMLVSGLIGLAASAVFLALMVPLWMFELTLGELFLARGWVPFALTFLMAWSVAILVLKSRKLARQRASMLFDLLPTELSEEISEQSLGKFIDHVRGLPVESGSSFLVNRVLRGLEHFRVRKSTPEVAAMLASQSEIDANAVDSSYTLLKVFIWAIPILGFIGTVIGISAAVGGFSGSLDAAEDVSVLKESLNGVTGGLATAFDTTLIALVMSMLVMFPTSSMQKAEEDLLNWVDEYCNENLLKRLNDGPRSIAAAPQPSSNGLEGAIQSAMAPHHAELRTWSKKLEAIGQSITRQVVDGWGEVNQQQQAEQQQIAAQAQQLAELAGRIGQQLETAGEQWSAAQVETSQSLAQSAAALQTSLGQVQQGLASLNDVLSQLNGKQVVVEQPKKRGWFGR